MQKIDVDITKIRKRIAKAMQGVEFQQLMTFNIHDTIDSHKDIKSQGIYLFEIKCSSLDELTAFYNMWNNSNKTKGIKNFPKIIESHFKYWAEIEPKSEWIAMYIGKSEDLSKRIDEHINLNPNSSTYSMKLCHRLELKNYTFRCSIIKLKLKNYDWIAYDVEKFMRDKYKPIIGKQ